MNQDSEKQQDKLAALKQQIADQQHPQQSDDRKERLADAELCADKILAELNVTADQDSE
jgi:hypothetical protein